MDSRDEAQIQLNISDTFHGGCVLITGASGFLGKVLLEKLLFSQPEIHKIFLLIRPLKGEEARTRMEKLLESPIFNRVRCVDEQRFKKLVPISGNLMADEIGLSERDRTMLAEEVSVVFHCAATVKFDEALRVSIQMNVIGTQRLASLCRRMNKLKAFVHASTAYANCNLASTQERVYEQPVKAAHLVEATMWMSNDMLDTLATRLLEGRPNTYTFAKALAESQLLEDQREQPLPIVIVRPSIIGAVWREPLPGWIDNVNGPTGIIVGVGKGLLTDMCGDVASNADIIPVDCVSNLMIAAAAYKSASNVGTTNEIPVIHCTSGGLNPIKWGRIVNYLEQFLMAFPFAQCYRTPSTQFHNSRRTFMLNFYAKHYSIAQSLDLVYRMLGKQPKFVRIYGKIWRMIEQLHYFTTREWKFESENAPKLLNYMSEEERKLYNFDVRNIDWDKYLFDYLMGVKLYLLNERLDDLPRAQANLSWLKQMNLYANGAVVALLIRIFAWRRPKRQKWMLWFCGFLLTYVYQNFNGLLRQKIYLRSLDEYKAVSMPHYALLQDQKQRNP